MTARQIAVEVCVESAQAVARAAAAGADRVELCSALILGGLTPSAGTIAQALRHTHRRPEPATPDVSERPRSDQGPLGVHILIRPREGDFVYAPVEVDTMLADIAAARQVAADTAGEVGFVIGALTAGGQIDGDICRELIAAAEPHPVSFHRAFDITGDLDRALDDLIELGVVRVLTGGGAQRAHDGIPTLARLVDRAAGRIAVMPGGSVRAHNIAAILTATGASDVHFQAPVPEANRWPSGGAPIPMSASAAPNHSDRPSTSEEQVRELVRTVGTLAATLPPSSAVKGASRR